MGLRQVRWAPDSFLLARKSSTWGRGTPPSAMHWNTAWSPTLDRSGVGVDGGGVLGHYDLAPAPPVLHSIVLQVQLARQLHLVHAKGEEAC